MTAIAQWPRLLAHILKRDRISLPVWILAVVSFCAGFVPAMPAIIGTNAEMAVMGEMMANPAMIAMCGIFPNVPFTIAIFYTQMMLVWSALLVAAMNILIVIRHTRADEDEGRSEVIRALPVGRGANLMAVIVLMIAVNVIMAILIGVSMPAFGIESVDLAGSLVYGAALGACGLFFAGLTVVVAQVMDNARSVTGLALGLMGGFYLLRAYGDVSSETAAWLSPFGAIQRTYPYSANDWWPAVGLAGLGVILMVVGFALGGLRDLGRGLLGQGRGRRAHGSVFLGGEWGLAWRLTRGPILGWGIAIFVMAAAFGSVMGQMEDFIMSNPLYQAMIGVGADATDIVAPLLVTLMLITATMAAIPVLTTAHKLASEERLGRMDYLLGKTVSRWRLFLGYGILVVLVAVAMQLLAAVGYWMVAATIMTDPLPASMVFKIALNAVPALIVVGGLAFFLVGWAKQLTWINWGYLGLSFLMVYVGGMLNLPRWAMRITPFGMLQRWPQEDFSLILWLGMIAVGAVLAVLGATAYRRRDIIN